MSHLISTSRMSFESPKRLVVGGKVYDNITGEAVFDIVDSDNSRKQVYYLDGNRSSYSSYVQNDKVVRSTEFYYRPVTRRLGDKVYNNITSKRMIAGKNYVTYVIESPSGGYNEVREYNSGHVLDTKELKSRALKRKLVSPFKKLAQIIH